MAQNVPPPGAYPYPFGPIPPLPVKTATATAQPFVVKLGARVHVLHEGRWVCGMVTTMERYPATGFERALVERVDVADGASDPADALWFPTSACQRCTCPPKPTGK